jgi:integrase
MLGGSISPVLVGVTTGMRRGEILGLRWSDVDLKAGKLTVNQSLERLGGKTVFKPPKTAGSRRTITLPALTVEALSAHRAEQARIGSDELVFSHDGIPWDPDTLRRPSTD